MASASAAVSGVSGRAGRVHRCWSFGQLRSAASLPPPYQTGWPSLVVSSGSATAYPVTWPGSVTLYRSRTSTPALFSRAKNSSVLPADAAAVATWRRRVDAGHFLPQGPDRLDSLLFGHYQIRDHQVHPPGTHPLERLLSIGRFGHFVAAALQHRPQKGAHSRIVVRHQDPGRLRGPRQHCPDSGG